MLSWKFRGIARCVAAVMVGVLSTSPAFAKGGTAEEANPEVVHRETLEKSTDLVDLLSEPATTMVTRKGDIAVRAARYTVVCTPTANSPHGSSGAAKEGKYYIIAKVRVSCKGTGAHPGSVTIQVWSALMWNAAKSKSDPEAIKGSWRSLATSKEYRIVRVDGKANTFYVPQKGVTGGTRTGLYQLSTTVSITKPTGQKIGRDLSNVRVCRVTKSSASCTN